jgi:hypothetical protein
MDLVKKRSEIEKDERRIIITNNGSLGNAPLRNEASVIRGNIGED